METTELVPARRWTERGTWRGVTAALTLDFADSPGGGCLVSAELRIDLPAVLRPVEWLLVRAAERAVPADLRRAAVVLQAQ